MPTALRGHADFTAHSTMNKHKTCKRHNIPGHAHFLTISCFHGQAFLSKDRSRQWLIEAIDRARRLHHFNIWAYVIMREHAHSLFWPTERAYDISEILSSIKQSVAKRALIFVRREAPVFLAQMADRQPNGDIHYRFWQRGGGYDRNAVELGAIHHQIIYIHNNPVRRSLCEKPEDWYWSSAADHAGVRVGPLRIDLQSLPMIVSF